MISLSVSFFVSNHGLFLFAYLLHFMVLNLIFWHNLLSESLARLCYALGCFSVAFNYHIQVAVN